MMTYENLSTEAIVARAEQLKESGKLNEALEAWRIATQREADPVALCEFADLAMQLEKSSEAEQALLKAVELAPDLPNPLTLRGFLYFEQDGFEKAIIAFERSLALEASSSLFTALGVSQLELGWTDAARVSLEKAITLDPNYEEAYYNLGISYRETDSSKAIDSFETAVRLDPGYSAAQRELGWALSRVEGKDPEAEYHLRRAIELNHQDGWAFIYLGNILWKRYDLIAAEESFKKAIEVWPEIAVPYWCLALFYEQMERKQEAERLYEQGVSIDPDDPQANKLFGIYLKHIGQSAKARLYLERAHALSSGDKGVNR